MKVPLYRPDIDRNDINLALKALKSCKLSRGEYTERFEKEFAKFAKKKYAISLNSGTSGLHVLIRVMGWKKGDEVITSPFSYIASSNVLLLENIKPVFVDIDRHTLNINLEAAKKKITPHTKGILLVHILGLPADPSGIRELKKENDLKIIEDACETIGRPGPDFPVGDFGIASVYAFHENKQMTSGGEGGMIVTDDAAIAEKCKSMRDQGRSEKKDWINHVILGFNFRMTEMQAAIGLSQLKRIDAILKRRDRVAEMYQRLLEGVPDVVLPQDLCRRPRSWFCYYILLKDEPTRNILKSELERRGIATSNNYFPPIYVFPEYKKFGFKAKNFPATEEISKRLLVLPFFNDISVEEMEYVADRIKQILRK